MELKRVVVTGLGAVTPVGNNPEETWNSLLAGKSGAAPITHFDTTLFKTKFACEVKDLSINDWIDRKEARKLDRYTQLAMIAAMQGVKDAEIDLEKDRDSRSFSLSSRRRGPCPCQHGSRSSCRRRRKHGPCSRPCGPPRLILRRTCCMRASGSFHPSTSRYRTCGP